METSTWSRDMQEITVKTVMNGTFRAKDWPKIEHNSGNVCVGGNGCSDCGKGDDGSVNSVDDNNDHDNYIDDRNMDSVTFIIFHERTDNISEVNFRQSIINNRDRITVDWTLEELISSSSTASCIDLNRRVILLIRLRKASCYGVSTQFRLLSNSKQTRYKYSFDHVPTILLLIFTKK